LIGRQNGSTKSPKDSATKSAPLDLDPGGTNVPCSITRASLEPANPGEAPRGAIDDDCHQARREEEELPRRRGDQAGALELDKGYNAKGYHPPYFAKPELCNGCDMCGLYCPDFAIFGYREKLDDAA
jgi:NAD-dependent dihydropyrimidine dehydrogenase PreA subunit